MTKINTHDQKAFDYHAQDKPGKIAICPTKPVDTQQDLALAYTPGVAAPCLSIEKDPAMAYEYTSKGNLVAVISNGTAILAGLLASQINWVKGAHYGLKLERVIREGHWACLVLRKAG